MNGALVDVRSDYLSRFRRKSGLSVDCNFFDPEPE